MQQFVCHIEHIEASACTVLVRTVQMLAKLQNIKAKRKKTAFHDKAEDLTKNVSESFWFDENDTKKLPSEHNHADRYPD